MRGAHFLEITEGETSQDMERKGPSEEHSPTVHPRGRDRSGHGIKATERVVLTSWRPQREGQVRTRKGSVLARCTHSLETVEGGTSQGMKRKRVRALTSWKQQREGQVRTRTECEKPWALTPWRMRKEGQVMTRKESD